MEPKSLNWTAIVISVVWAAVAALGIIKWCDHVSLSTRDAMTRIRGPGMESDLILRRCLNPRAIAVTVGSKRALQWLRANDSYFDPVGRDLLLWLDTGEMGVELPTETTVLVLECFDFDKVYRYLNAERGFRDAVIRGCSKTSPDCYMYIQGKN